jgi:hypothetical protein
MCLLEINLQIALQQNERKRFFVLAVDLGDFCDRLRDTIPNHFGFCLSREFATRLNSKRQISALCFIWNRDPSGASSSQPETHPAISTDGSAISAPVQLVYLRRRISAVLIAQPQFRCMGFGGKFYGNRDRVLVSRSLLETL